jgi:hypothetical protein
MSPERSVGLHATHEKRVEASAQQARVWVIERNLAIVDALEAGISSRKVASWAGLTHTAVLSIRRNIRANTDQVKASD